MKKNILIYLLLIIGAFTNVWAQKTITGIVKDKKANEPLIGASVIIKGTTIGVITDIDGKYEIQAQNSDVLQYSFIGLDTKEETVGDQTVINVELTSEGVKLDEVVVTAMGIQRKAKSLTYATQQVGGEELTRAKETNLINSLQGKTAGLTITPSTSGAGGSSKLLIRGNKSAQGNNQPLIVIDGMPMSNYSPSQGGDRFSMRDGGDALSNINPDDIASINVLKGASAAALYGSMAANGVILINTKRGREGKIRVDVSSNITVDQAAVLPNLQNEYGAVVSGDGSLSAESWGDKITGDKKGANRVDDFYRLGATYINSVALSGGNQNAQAYASYANTRANGIMETNSFQRHNMTLKESLKMFDDKLTIDASLNFIIQKIKNRPQTGQYHNPLTGLYTFPANGDWDYYKNNYAIYDKVNNWDAQQWYTNINQDFSANPYWVLNKDGHEENRNRIIASGTVKYQLTDYLNVQGRLSYDKAEDRYQQKMYATTSHTLVSPNGAYVDRRTMHRQFYGDLMLNFNKKFGEWNVSAALGTSFSDKKTEGLNIGDGSQGAPILPNYFVAQNYSQNTTTMSETKERLNSVFGTAQFGWKDMLFLDVTGRNDWSSTLAFTSNTSFFYPSVGLTGVVSDMVELPEIVSLLKVRGSYSIVGNGMPAFITNPTNGFSNGSVTINNNTPFKEMEPEKLKSLEIGFDLSLLNNRINWDVTYYKSNNTNQYFSMGVPAGTGYSNYYFNAGNIQNSGIETSISYSQNLTEDLTWKAGINLSYNDNEIIELDDRLPYAEINGGDISMRLVEGGSYGDLYGKVLVRDANGVIQTDDKGQPMASDEYELVGNANSKWNIGFNNTFHYKDFQLYFLIDGKIGGDFYDKTQSMLDRYGVSQATADARNNGGVDAGDGTMIDPQKYFTTIPGNIDSEYLYDATNFRLREVSLGYTFRDLFGVSKNLTLNLIGRNLFFIYKDCPSDPDLNMGLTNAQASSAYFAMPSTRSFGFNVKATF